MAAEGIVSDNPTIDIDSDKVKKRLPQTLSPAEVERLLESPSNINTPKNLRDVVEHPLRNRHACHRSGIYSDGC